MPKKTKSFVEPVAPPEEEPKNSYKYMAAAFVAVVVLLLVGIAYLVLAKATITLVPAEEPLTKEFYLTIAESPENSTSTPPIIGGQVLSEKITASEEYQVKEGSKTMEAQATGKVTIYNRRNLDQTLVATTRLLSRDGVLFRLKDKVIVPANGSVEAHIYADKAGKAGEIEATTFTIPGLSAELQKLIFAESLEPTQGGEKKIGVLTQADVDQAIEQFKKKQLQDLVTKTLAQITSGNLSLVGAKIETDGQKFTTDKDLGEEVSSFKLTGEMTIGAVFAEEEKIFQAASEEMKNTSAGQGTEINVNQESLQYELEAIEPGKKEATAKIQISGLANFDPTKNIFDKNILVGFTKSDLQLYFSQFKAIKDVGVEFSPFWVKKVPILKNHIEIKIQGK